MKITKSVLKKIIQEEIENLLYEELPIVKGLPKPRKDYGSTQDWRDHIRYLTVLGLGSDHPSFDHTVYDVDNMERRHTYDPPDFDKPKQRFVKMRNFDLDGNKGLDDADAQDMVSQLVQQTRLYEVKPKFVQMPAHVPKQTDRRDAEWPKQGSKQTDRRDAEWPKQGPKQTDRRAAEWPKQGPKKTNRRPAQMPVRQTEEAVITLREEDLDEVIGYPFHGGGHRARKGLEAVMRRPELSDIDPQTQARDAAIKLTRHLRSEKTPSGKTRIRYQIGDPGFDDPVEENVVSLTEEDLHEDWKDYAGLASNLPKVGPVAYAAGMIGTLGTLDKLNQRAETAPERGEKFRTHGQKHEVGLPAELQRAHALARATIDNWRARAGDIKPIWDAPLDYEEMMAQQKKAPSVGTGAVEAVEGGRTEKAMAGHGIGTGQKRSPYQTLAQASKYRTNEAITLSEEDLKQSKTPPKTSQMSQPPPEETPETPEAPPTPEQLATAAAAKAKRTKKRAARKKTIKTAKKKEKASAVWAKGQAMANRRRQEAERQRKAMLNLPKALRRKQPVA